jgi:hypothetical protein
MLSCDNSLQVTLFALALQIDIVDEDGPVGIPTLDNVTDIIRSTVSGWVPN